MIRSKFIKALTLFSFISFLTAFLLYRTGYFDPYTTVEDPALQTSHNGGTITPAKPDSLVTMYKLDSAQMLRLSSSKSIVLVDKNPIIFPTIKQPKKSVYTEKPIMWSGSKSGIIFTPPRVQLKIDSIKFDLEKIKRIKD